jgi:hypothetical protein
MVCFSWLAAWMLMGPSAAAAPSDPAPIGAEPSAEAAGLNAADEWANQTAREVFAGEPYWWKRTTDVESSQVKGLFSSLYELFIEPIFKGIAKILKWLFNRLPRGLGLGTGDWSNGLPFLWTLVAALVVFVAWRLAMVFRQRPTVRPAVAGQVAVDVLPRADQLLEQSRVALAQGEHRLAIRLALLSLLAWLHDRGRVSYDLARSNREYQQDLRRWPESAVVFGAVAAPFERCWYGGRDLEASQVNDAIALCRNHFQIAKDSP